MDAKDERLDPFRDFTLKSLKLNPDKWQQFIGEKNNRIILSNFFDKCDYCSLFLSLDAAAQLVGSLDFPRNIQNKAIHFSKRKGEVITKDNMKGVVTGEVANAALDAAVSVTEQVVSLLLGSAPSWPEVVSQDVCLQLQRLKDEALEVRGRVQGRTFLPLPGRQDALQDADGRKWLHVFDSVIIDWTQQVSEVLSLDSSQSVLDGLKPVPQQEFDFWTNRLLNLQCISAQLMSPKARKMAFVVEKAESVYWPVLRKLCQDVQQALREAADVVLHLKPLQKILQDAEHMDFTQLRSNMAAVMHTVCLVWSRCRFYSRPARIVILLQQICNLFINMSRKFLRPEEVMTGLTSESCHTLHRIRLSIQTLQSFRHTYSSVCKDGNSRSWDFPSHLVFCHLDAFLKRLQSIEEVYSVCVLLSRLQQVELQGVAGGALSDLLQSVNNDFLQCVNTLAACRTDATDTDDQSVDVSLQQFQDDITDFEWRLGCLLCRVWDDCPAAEAAGKLLEMFGFMLERPLIRQQLRHKSLRLVRLLSGELERAERLLDGRREAGGAAGKNLPPAAGRLARAHHLRQRVQTAMRSYEAVRHLCLDSEEAELLLRQYDRTSVLLRQYCDAVYSDWSGRVDADCDFGLEQSVMLRSRDDLLRVNFTPQLAAVLREVKYLQAQRNVPPRAAEIFSRRQTFRKNICSLELLVSCYNQVVSSVSVEFPLVQQQLQEVQEKLTEAERLTWSCEGWQLIQQIREQLCEFHCRLSRARANMDAMTRSIQAWSVSPLLERTGGQTDSLLDLEGGAQLDRRYTQIRESGAELLRLTQENRELLGAEPAESWVRYLDHIDDKVLDGFFQLLSISLHFLSDNMNPESGGAPLLCVCVQLQEAECVLSCRLTDRLKSLLDQIYTAAELIHPLSVCRDPHQLALQQQVELCVLRGEVLRRGQEVQEEAERLREQLDRFSFLWQDDRQEVMQQFLTYGRVPSPEELEAEAPPPAAPPTLQDFSREVESYERLRGEASRLDERPVLSGWLRLDLRPFRRSLLSVIQSWRRMFTQHLLESVCSSLQQLKVPQGLEESQAASACRFPLRETIVMLEASGVELPDDVYAQLQWQ